MVDSGVRRSCDSAASTAVRTRSALPQSFGLFGLVGEPVPFHREDGLRGEHLDQPPVRRRQRLPVHGQHPARFGWSGRDENVGGVGVHGVPEFGGQGRVTARCASGVTRW